ncbi:MAG: methyltransferase domain-containing protein [Chloroflexi bacterium]|nr:methyltransferase domain-containing protein [Chloroflexota bacterium]
MPDNAQLPYELNHEHEEAPAEFLVENIQLLPVGKVLDIAMGRGQNAVYLAGLGFDVEGVDISAQSVSDALQLAATKHVSIKAITSDLEKDYQIKEDTYNVIICFNYLQRSLMNQIKAGLKKGGVLVYETFILDQARFGKPRNPDHLLMYNELLDIFRDFRCLRYREGIMPGPKAIAGIVAEKV